MGMDVRELRTDEVAGSMVSAASADMRVSVASAESMDVQVARNDSPVDSRGSPGASPADRLVPQPHPLEKQQLSTKSSASVEDSKLRSLLSGESSGASAIQPVDKSAKRFDIDSLNEIKKANDLASKKVEMTNYIFDMLLREIKTDLFPIRQGIKVKRRSKRRQ